MNYIKEAILSRFGRRIEYNIESSTDEVVTFGLENGYSAFFNLKTKETLFIQDSMDIKYTYNRLLEAEKAFADAIDDFSSSLADDPKIRNHPRRTIWGSKVMNSHSHWNFQNMMADIQLDMEGDGFLFMD